VILVVRLLPLVVAAAIAADTPAGLRPAGDDDIRAAFAGKAACEPQPSGIGLGPHEFHADGVYRRARDLASAHGRYAVADSRICVTLMESEQPDFCFAVLVSGGRYLFRLDDQPPAQSNHAPVPVEPCPLPNP
jgi:hypothetical protein